MLRNQLLALLGLESAADDAALLAAVEQEHNERLAFESECALLRQQLDATNERLVTSHTLSEEQLETEVAARTFDVHLRVALDGAYREGRLVFGRDPDTHRAQPSAYEAQLRTLAETQGLDAMRAELARMPIAIPLNRRPLDEATEPPPTFGGGSFGAPRNSAPDVALVKMYSSRLNKEVSLTTELASVAAQMELDPADVLDTLERIGGGL